MMEVDDMVKELLAPLGWKYSYIGSISSWSMRFTRPKNHKSWVRKVWKPAQFDALDVTLFFSTPSVIAIRIRRNAHLDPWPLGMTTRWKQFDLHSPSSIGDIEDFVK